MSRQFRVPGEIVLEYEHVPFVLGSEVRLTQVFFNLLLNAAQALDHAKSERNRVIVRVRSVPPTRVRIDIEDTGAGVPVEIARKLFSPFVSSRPRGLGKGLGLFVAREIVRALSGELSYRSEPGQGTTFNVVLPSGGARGSATRLDGRLSSAIAAARILVVNSDRGVAAALRRILSPAELVLVRSPALALELLQERFDVVFAELLGATSDGLELIDHAAAVDARLGSRLVLTSHLEFSGDQREKAAATGIAVLDKPFDRAALRAAVAAALGVPVDG